MNSHALFETDLPARLDALLWSRWHSLVVIALGITWVLDGLEVTLAGAVGSALRDPHTLGLSDAQIGLSGTTYLAGAVTGALLFGYATDRFGRRKLFFLTLLLYVGATAATACSWSAGSYCLFRALTGAGIGGEYAAINSAIDELIPARIRGHVDLIINSTFWLGAAMGSGITIFLLDLSHLPPAIGWRLAFGVGAALGLIILFLRNIVPESPRWLLTRGRVDEAEKIVSTIEQKVAQANPSPTSSTQPSPPVHRLTTFHPRPRTPVGDILQVMLVKNRTRTLLGMTLMIAQAFFYNAIGFFTFGLMLEKFYDVQPSRVGWYLLPFALGNMFGPIVLGKLFDVVGRKPMIVFTYAASGILLALAGLLFETHLLTAMTQTIAWTAVFFIASCASSAAYLTVSEIFPMEMRGMAIAIFYAAGTLIGGVAAPMLFGRLIATNSRHFMLAGYLFTALLMLLAAAVEAIYGVKAEGKSLEELNG